MLHKLETCFHKKCVAGARNNVEGNTKNISKLFMKPKNGIELQDMNKSAQLSNFDLEKNANLEITV